MCILKIFKVSRVCKDGIILDWIPNHLIKKVGLFGFFHRGKKKKKVKVGSKNCPQNKECTGGGGVVGSTAP